MASNNPIAAASRTEPTVETSASPVPSAPQKISTDPNDRPQLTRLVIEEVNGRYVYKVVDRNTGRVLTQLPREEVEQLGELDGYNAGAVVSTKA
jgi:hypothetical protein